MEKKQIRGSFNNLIIQSILMIWLIFQLFPLIWILYSSLKPTVDINSNLLAFPKAFYLENYDFKSLYKYGITMGAYFKNSVVVTILSLSILVIVSLLAGYAIAKIRFPGKNILIVVLMGMLGIPIQTIIIPLYYYIVELGLLNNIFGLVLPYVAFNFPFSVLLLQSYFRQFPDEIIEAAKVDGCGNIRIFISIVMPISFGAISAVLIINFLNIWNEFLFAFIIMKNNLSKTLPVGISGFNQLYRVDWGPLFAGLTIAVIPTIIFYFIFHRNIIKGVIAGSIKG